jgi:hypothetical protein
MATYTLISSNVLTSSAASVTFSAIPATFTDLVLRGSIRTDFPDPTDAMLLRFNGDSSSLYSVTSLRGSGAAVVSNRQSSATSISDIIVNADTATSNTFSVAEFYIPSYIVSQNKPSSIFYAQERNATSPVFIGAQAALYRSTTAISSLTLTPRDGTNFLSGSSFYLYGISNA